MEAEQNYIVQPKENVIGELWAKYFPYWPVYLLLITIAIGGTWLYLNYKLPVYEATATLLIKDEKKGIEDSKMVESLNLFYSKKIIENEIEVIKSRDLMDQVVKELKLYAPVFEKAKWKDPSAYASSPIKIEVQSPDSLVEVDKIYFIYDLAGKKVNIQGHFYSLDTWENTPWGKLRFSQNNKEYRLKSPLYFALVNPQRIIKDVISRFSVVPISKLSTVVSLKILDEVPQRSKDILATLIANYDKAEVNDKNFLTENTITFLDERLQYVSRDLTSIEKQLQQYKSKKGAIDISSQGKLFLENVSVNDQKLSDVNMKIAVLKQVEEYLLSKNTRGGIVPSTTGIDDPLLTSLLNKLYDTELQYEKLKSTSGENNQVLISLADQIEKIKPSVLENIHSQQQSLEASKRNLYSTNNSYTSSLQALPQQERDLVEISREQNIKSSIYSFLLQKKEETALSQSSAVSDTRIVDRAAYSLDPVGFGSILYYLCAIILALIIGVALVTARELFSHSILFRKEIEAATSFPVIGEISFEGNKNALVIKDGKTTFIAEQFRMLRASLSHLGISARKKKILITSTISGEGKSFVAANLALSLAMAGKRVVLVEFDLSNPTLAHKFGMEGGKGVSDFLAEEVNLKDVIIKTHANDNLFLISAGNLPANPSDLIMSHRSASLLHELEEIFDYVLVDSAPVGLLSDGYILSQLCDATLYIAKHGNTPKKMLERLNLNNKINELKNLAIVFNGVRSRGFGSNKYGYGYGYGYLYNQKYSIKNKI